MEDLFDLARFLNAQAGVYPQVLAELQAVERFIRLAKPT